MRKLPSDDLRVYFVWMPVLPADGEAAAAAHGVAETDGRATHFWDSAQALGLAYADPMPPPHQKPLAWDVVLLFPRGARWDAALPRPALYMYPRAAGEAPAFDAEVFGRRVAQTLGR